MKKILFLQLKGNSLGGVWFVNKTLGEEFIKKNYEVSVLALRNNHPGMEELNTDLKIEVINKKDKWERYTRRDVLKSIKKMYFFKTLYKYIKEELKVKKDLKKMKQKINQINPDIILVSHYHLLLGIPEKYLKKTIYTQHSSIEYMLHDRKNISILKKYQNKIYKVSWLSESSMKEAIKLGINNSISIYNPNRFETEKQSEVDTNKKIIVITRIHPEKRIDFMIQMVHDVLKEKKYQDWTFEIYGIGEFNKKSLEIMNQNNQIKYLGVTDNPMQQYLQASLTLNTSLEEGFPLSIMEANTCGVPAICFHYGASCKEQIIDGYNGYIVNKNEEETFKNKIKYLLDNPIVLKKMGENAKEFSKRFEKKQIVEEWINIFKEIR